MTGSCFLKVAEETVSSVEELFSFVLIAANESAEVRRIFCAKDFAKESLFSQHTSFEPAAAAGNVFVTLYPSNRLRRLLAAARAGDVDFLILEHWSTSGGSS